MNKYLTVLVGIFVFQSAFADSYVFGGRAHFNGTLVNPGCSFSQDSNLKHLASVNQNHFLELNVSNCASTIYYNLAIAVKDIGNTTRGANLSGYPEQAFYFAPGTNLQHSNVYERSMLTQPENGIANAVPEAELTSIDETVVLPLSKLNAQLAENNTNILLSVFYP